MGVAGCMRGVVLAGARNAIEFGRNQREWRANQRACFRTGPSAPARPSAAPAVPPCPRPVLPFSGVLARVRQAPSARAERSHRRRFRRVRPVQRGAWSARKAPSIFSFAPEVDRVGTAACRGEAGRDGGGGGGWPRQAVRSGGGMWRAARPSSVGRGHASVAAHVNTCRRLPPSPMQKKSNLVPAPTRAVGLRRLLLCRSTS